MNIGAIVEGHGDALALPELFRRIAADATPGMRVQVFPPHRVARGVRARDLISSGTREGPDAGDE